MSSENFEVYCFDCGWKLVAQVQYRIRQVGARFYGIRITFYGPIVDDYGTPVEEGGLTPIAVCPGCDMLLRGRHVQMKSGQLLSDYLQEDEECFLR